MVRNAERIYAEIETQAALAEQKHGIPAAELTVLVMEVVKVVHEHRQRFTDVNVQIENRIDQSAKAHSRRENE